jgi:hypothetical protein
MVAKRWPKTRIAKQFRKKVEDRPLMFRIGATAVSVIA